MKLSHLQVFSAAIEARRKLLESIQLLNDAISYSDDPDFYKQYPHKDPLPFNIIVRGEPVFDEAEPRHLDEFWKMNSDFWKNCLMFQKRELLLVEKELMELGVEIDDPSDNQNASLSSPGTGEDVTQ